MVICDFKIFLYEISAEKGTPGHEIQQVVDMR